MARRKKTAAASGELFIEDSGQLRVLDKSVEQRAIEKDRVECLGRTFDSDAARRAFFLEDLRKKLKDPEFRKTEGFPRASDDDILAMSDPPYYTACPNPFLADFVRCYGRAYDPAVPYAREPFAVDTSAGKTDPLYTAHGYHTKVPHLAIVPSILHYTEPGDVVLDGFCGSGMTGIAAQWCGAAPSEFRTALEAEWAAEKRPAPRWGARRVVLNDLSPAASFIAANFNIPFDLRAFSKAAQALLADVEREVGWMYETLHTDGGTKGRINYTVWSEVFACPDCSGEVVFLKEALDPKTKRVHETFPCPHCKASLTKDTLERCMETQLDPSTHQPWEHVKFRPIFVNYQVGTKRHEKPFGPTDQALWERIERLPLPLEVPTNRFPIEQMAHGSRLAPKGFTHAHHLFLARQAQALAVLWRRARAESDPRTRNMLLWFVEQAIWGMSLLNRYKTIMHGKTESSNVNQYLSGVYYVPSQHSEVSPWYNLENRAGRLSSRAFATRFARHNYAALTVGSCASLPLDDSTIDYVFTDPPFGENIYYADLNYLVESWHRAITDAGPEAIVDRAKKKDLGDYQNLMRRGFAEYARVLKPGRWMTVVFHNSQNAVWNAIQEAMLSAGFVVADVRTLDKQQGSYRQITSTAVKQDLVISAYKPTEALEHRFEMHKGTEEGAWDFTRDHLRHLPIFVEAKGRAEVVAERQAYLLFDRMVAFHIQRRASVPLSAPEFYAGLNQRFSERDGMYFLPEQVGEYERRRAKHEEIAQQALLVTDEKSAIQWLRRTLERKPGTYQELHPLFTRELHKAEYERTVELKDILRESFLEYDGVGPVPNQIHAYLSSNFKELRNLAKDDPALVAKARERWYVPDMNKQLERDKVRERALLKEFELYKEAKQARLKEFRTEAVRAGFKAAWNARDYKTIVNVARKLPESVVQEDPFLVQFVDNASTLLDG
ncbi:MAG: DNA methylase [Deltaproteobacteria bacterium]|nr:DNA methylase [Deltaproteobacteria bacterium]